MNKKKTAERIIEEKAETYAGLILDVRKRSGAFSGYIAGYRSAAQETVALREELEQLRWVKDCSNELGKNFAIRIQELKQKNEQLKEVVKELLPMCNTLYVDMSIEEFNAKIENAKKLTGQI